MDFETTVHVVEQLRGHSAGAHPGAAPEVAVGPNPDLKTKGVTSSPGLRSTGQDELRRAIWASLGQLTQRDFRSLAAYAGRQLQSVNLHHLSGEDLVQQAALTIAIGACHASKGRHPRMSDLKSHADFTKYLRGVIHSLVDTQRCLLECHFAHAEWKEGSAEAGTLDRLSFTSKVYEEVAFKDFSESLFRRLSAQVPDRLRRILVEWREQRFDCDAIPLQGQHRRLRAELRAQAARVIRVLATTTTRSPFVRNDSPAGLTSYEQHPRK